MSKSSGRVLVIGASGAVGQEILKCLERENSVREIAVVANRPLDARLKTSKVREYPMSFGSLDAESECFDAEAVFCAIGTTMRKAGSEAQFRKVDHDIPLDTAQIAKLRGVPHFLIVSAHGADTQSRFFYNRVKGSVEQDLMALHLPHLTIIRPSILIRRSNEWRPLEWIGQKVA